jgi:hypothetical protein
MSTPTWGPFTGRQLTTMVIVIAAVIGIPGTVWAVDTFTNVAIEDPVTGVKASVDATHKVLVGDGSGSLTVDGSLTARPYPPASPWRASEDLGGSTAFKPIAGPSSSAINLTAIAATNKIGSAADLRLLAYAVAGTATACGTTTYLGTIWHIYPPANTTFTQAFPTPMQVRPPTGQKVCLYASDWSTDNLILNASGFYGT